MQVKIEVRTDQVASDNKKLWPGLIVMPLNDQLKQNMDLDKDAKGLVVVQVVDGSPANVIGIKQGDRITAVNGVTVADIAAFYKVLRDNATAELWFGLLRGDATVESMKFKR